MRLEKRPFCTSFSELVKALKHFPLSDSTKNRSHTNISPCCFGILEERWLSSNLFQETWSDIWPLLNRPTFLTTQVIFVIWELMRETSFHTENSMKEKNSCLIFCHICHFQSKITIFQLFSKVYFFFLLCKRSISSAKMQFCKRGKK